MMHCLSYRASIGPNIDQVLKLFLHIFVSQKNDILEKIESVGLIMGFCPLELSASDLIKFVNTCWRAVHNPLSSSIPKEPL